MKIVKFSNPDETLKTSLIFLIRCMIDFISNKKKLVNIFKKYKVIKIRKGIK